MSLLSGGVGLDKRKSLGHHIIERTTQLCLTILDPRTQSIDRKIGTGPKYGAL